jgi:hypothetical protein
MVVKRGDFYKHIVPIFFMLQKTGNYLKKPFFEWFFKIPLSPSGFEDTAFR